ncbi:Gfo/Idh/MocA family oxidoreductase [Anoxybacillus kestanbolensis]|uniref:Gfo/Idh/MocA family oxidoreductase n=1 Tax=Anoxybacillus kestanbolensis TaxID=227476 RepID=UPI003D1F8F8D
MKKVLIVGAGKGGSALLKMFHETKLMDVVAIVDRNDDAPGMKIAREMGIQTSKRWCDVLTEDIDVVVNVAPIIVDGVLKSMQ